MTKLLFSKNENEKVKGSTNREGSSSRASSTNP